MIVIKGPKWEGVAFTCTDVSELEYTALDIPHIRDNGLKGNRTGQWVEEKQALWTANDEVHEDV